MPNTHEAQWLIVLREQVNARSQSRVAAELSVSKTMISQVLNGKYPADPADLRRKVEGHYLHRTVTCPVLGVIPVHECEAHQQREFSATNPQRVRLYRACRSGCPHSRLEASAKTQRMGGEQASLGPTPYPVEEQIGYCQRMAEGDRCQHVERLERELRRLGTQYNQLLWQTQHKDS